MSLSLLCFYVYLSKDRDVNISDAGLAHLQGFTALQTLDLGSNQNISDAGLAHLHGLADLRRLYLIGCSGAITKPGLVELLDRCTRLEGISLPQCCKRDEEFIRQLEERWLEVVDYFFD